MATSSKQIRDSFRAFFEARGHRKLPSASLLPQNDPTLMFVNAGMVPFKDVFTGQDKRDYKRATTAQKCIRISGKHNDLENVGVTARHHTLFEMLGNFSFGDYFKEDAVAFAWEYLTGTLGIDKNRLVITVFGGEKNLPADTEAEELWKKVTGFSSERILRCGAADNFWSMGDTGPCGPCTELHYFFGNGKPDLSRFGAEPTEDGSGWVELWNLVFMQFDRSASGELANLPAPSIDTGAGLERLSCVVQNVVSNYDTDLLRPIVDLAAQLSGKKYGGTLQPDDVSMRVIADHARTTAFLIAEGVFPDRDAREYVLRRVMRRAIRHGHRLGIERPFLHECALLVTELMRGEYPELGERRELISQVALQEEERFRATLRRGLDRLSSYQFKSTPKVLPGPVAFELYDTFGFPIDLQEVIGREQGFGVDLAGFEAELGKARERSAGSKLVDEAVDAAYKALGSELPKTEFLGYATEQGSSAVTALLRDGKRVKQLATGERGDLFASRTPFYAESGGQVGDRGLIKKGDAVFRVEDTLKPLDGLFVHRGVVERGSFATGDAVELEVDHELRAATRRNHSATHLLHLALRAVVGAHAMQKGSLVGPDRLRFDYSAGAPLDAEQIKRIEAMVTERVLLNAEVVTEVLPMDEAKQKGAIGIFEEKYGSVVRMLRIADSLELCGGTHVARTGDIGAFKVLSDSGIAAGVRRIEAATGMNALVHVQRLEDELGAAAALLKGSPLQTRDKLEKLMERQREQAREIERLKRQLISGGSRDLRQDARKIGDVNVLGAVVEVGDPGALRELADKLRDQLAPSVIVLGSASPDGKALLICTVSSDLTAKHKAGALIRDIAAVVGGKGGGRPDFAQAGGPDVGKLQEAVERVYALVGA